LPPLHRHADAGALVEQDGRFVPERLLRASDFDGGLGEANNPDWKTVAIDEKRPARSSCRTGRSASAGARRASGTWRRRTARVRDERLRWPQGREDDGRGVAFPYFGNTARTFRFTDHPSVLTRAIPVRRSSWPTARRAGGDGLRPACANYGVDRGLGAAQCRVAATTTTALHAGLGREDHRRPARQIIAVAREFAANAEKTNGKSMVIIGAG
jgi:nitrate reductase alpha subunit